MLPTVSETRDRLLALNAFALLVALGTLGAASPSPGGDCGLANACDARLFSEVGRALMRGDGAVYGAMLRVEQAPELPFGYPPTALPLFALWGLGPARWSSVLSAVLGGAALGASAGRLGGRGLGVAAMAGGWAFFSAWLGQTGAWMGAAACGLAWSLQNGRRGLAGLCLAVLWLKPQLGLFAALALLGEGAVLGLAAAFTAALALASAAIWGPGCWADWWALVRAGLSGGAPVVDRGFMSTWQALVPGALEGSAALTTILAVLGAGLAFAAGRRRPPEQALAVGLTAGVLLAPHGHPYDLAVWVLPALGYGARGVLVLGFLVHLCALTGLRAPLALVSLGLLLAQMSSGVQRAGWWKSGFGPGKAGEQR